MVYILYTNEQYTDAGQILYFLTKEKNLSVSSYCENCYVLHADNRIDQDAAIVLLSNAAVMDENWQALVRDIPEGVRLIPVSSTKQLENIWDSLITETGFYDIKSRLLLNKNIWHFSKCSDDFLLSNSKKINEYLLLFQKKSEEEKNPYFRDELSEIVHYLEVSLQYSKKSSKKKVL